jgi:trigger factor
MYIAVEETGLLARRMTIKVLSEQIEKAVSEQLNKLSKKIQIAGFRPGKVPFKLVEQYHGETVRNDVIH